MLESVESKGLSHIIRWTDDEERFMIYESDLFLKVVLPLFFKSSYNNIRYFYSRLRLWGFTASRRSANDPVSKWYHPEFTRSNSVHHFNKAMKTGEVVNFLNKCGSTPYTLALESIEAPVRDNIPCSNLGAPSAPSLGIELTAVDWRVNGASYCQAINVTTDHAKKSTPVANFEVIKESVSGLADEGEGDHEEGQNLLSIKYNYKDTKFIGKFAFPLNLTRMLESVERKGLSHIVRWSDDGKSFVIYDVDLFRSDVLPMFFKVNEKGKIRSFHRRLNRWGFTMVRRGDCRTSSMWHNPDFNRTNAAGHYNRAILTGEVVDFLNGSGNHRS